LATQRHPEPSPTGPAGLKLLDLVALVVGYGMAALLMRAIWAPMAPDRPTLLVGLFVAFEFAWLGLAMGGPLVLLVDRRADAGAHGRPRYSWAESAWLLIGGYWLAMVILVVPRRLPVSPLLGLFPIAAALALRLFRRRRPPPPRDAPPTWTHRAALGLLVTWPFAWADMILLSRI
jgi:hypothetical protein